MSDIVERLREVAERADSNYPAIMEQAADEITRLTAEVERLKRLVIVQETLLRDKDALTAENAALSQQLGNLLAIIHRDGGHHTCSVGMDQSVKDAHLVWARLVSEVERLRGALGYALESGVGTLYWGDDDDCGTHKCCGEVSYKPHDPECWTVKARTALEEPEA